MATPLPRRRLQDRRTAAALPVACLIVIAVGCGRREAAPEPGPSPGPAVVTPKPPVTPPDPDPQPAGPKPAPPPEKPSPIRFRPEDRPPLNSQVPATYSVENAAPRRVGLKHGRRLSLDVVGGVTAACPLRDGTVLAGTSNGAMVRWNLATDQLVATFDLKATEVYSIVATPDETTAVVAYRSKGGNLVA